MELRHLRYFLAVAEERHFGRAAERLHMAQPPLSQQIRQLEGELGVTLLRRTTRKVELTTAGAAYLERTRSILADVEDAGQEAARVQAGLVGRLRIGCVGSATYSLLPALARTLREELPDVDCVFRGELLAPDQVAALLAGDLDLGLLRPPFVAEPALTVRTLRRERLLVALPDGHRLAGRARIRVRDLDQEALVVHPSRGRSVMHHLVTELFADAGVTPLVRHEVEETSTLVTFVAAGLGVAIVPEPVATLGVAGVVYRPLSPASVRIELAAATRVSDRSPVLDRAVAVLRRLSATGDRAG